MGNRTPRSNPPTAAGHPLIQQFSSKESEEDVGNDSIEEDVTPSRNISKVS